MKKKGEKEAHTGGVLADASADCALLLEVNVPAGRLAGLVLEGEGEDGLAVLDGVLAVGFAAAQSGVDGLEGLGGRECVCARACVSFLFFLFCPASPAGHVCLLCLPFLRDIVGESCSCELNNKESKCKEGDLMRQFKIDWRE